MLLDLTYDVTEYLQLPIDELIQAVDQSGTLSMLFRFVFEEFATCLRDDSEKTFIEDYLKRRGWRETSRARDYLRKFNDSELLIWSVVNVEQEEYVDLRLYNKPKSKEIRVHEKLGSRNLNIHDILIARVIELDNQRIFTSSVLQVPPETMNVFDSLNEIALENAIQQISDKQQSGALEKTTKKVIKKMAKIQARHQLANLALTTWLVYVYSVTNQSAPLLKDRSGDNMILCKVTFKVKQSSVTEIIQRLNTLPQLDYHQDEQEWVWIDGNAREMKTGLATRLGQLSLEKNALVLRCHSQQQAETGKKLILDTLDSLVSNPMMVLEDIDLDTSHPPILDDLDMASPEIQKTMQQYLDNYYRESLDEKIPMLDNKTPRQCSKTAKGKTKLVTWLQYLENNNANSIPGQPHYDFSWIWEELNLKQ